MKTNQDDNAMRAVVIQQKPLGEILSANIEATREEKALGATRMQPVREGTTIARKSHLVHVKRCRRRREAWDLLTRQRDSPERSLSKGNPL